MARTDLDTKSVQPSAGPRWTLTQQIMCGLLAGIAVGVFFGEACRILGRVGEAYVGFLQMTVLPYLTVSLVGKLGRLRPREAAKLGWVAVATLLGLWLLGILLVVAVSFVLPPVVGASFYSAAQEAIRESSQGWLGLFIPTNIFESLAHGAVPAVVVFCLLSGLALMVVPGKEPLLDLLDFALAAIGQLNMWLVRLAPLGLFALTASAAGTLRIDELARLQAYLLIFTLATAVAAIGVLPLIVSSLTPVPYGRLLSAAQEPLLTALATGKLFVVLPQIVDKCDLLLSETAADNARATPEVIVPLAYAFPHVGKILSFTFVSFAAWYVGQSLDTSETATMATTGAATSFASPLISIPFLLDMFQLPQDVMPLFILPGFLTTRLADTVGVLHLMAITLVVHFALQGRLKVSYRRLVGATSIVLFGACTVGLAGRWYLSSTALRYDLDDRFLTLSLTERHEDVTVHQAISSVPEVAAEETGLVLPRLREGGLLRVGYHPDHMPYSFFNRDGELVGMDIELMHRLGRALQVRMEFVPWTYDTLPQQLRSGQIDVAVGGLVVTPDRLLHVGFTSPYQQATLAFLVRDHDRDLRFDAPADNNSGDRPRMGIVGNDLARAAQRVMPGFEFVGLASPRDFFTRSELTLDGLVIAAQEGAVWNVLYPQYTVVIPQPAVHRPIAMAIRDADPAWERFLDQWLVLQESDGTFRRLQEYWVEGGGTQQQSPRWCIGRDVLHWW